MHGSSQEGEREGLTQSPSGRTQGPPQGREPPEAWLCQAVDSESPECPGSGQPPAHGRGDFREGRVLQVV